MNEKALLQRVRRMARKQDMRIVTLREGSPAYWRYGNYMVCGLYTGCVHSWGFDSVQKLVDYFTGG